jgi:hypothetical protein
VGWCFEMKSMSETDEIKKGETPPNEPTVSELIQTLPEADRPYATQVAKEAEGAPSLVGDGIVSVGPGPNYTERMAPLIESIRDEIKSFRDHRSNLIRRLRSTLRKPAGAVDSEVAPSQLIKQMVIVERAIDKLEIKLARTKLAASEWPIAEARATADAIAAAHPNDRLKALEARLAALEAPKTPPVA